LPELNNGPDTRSRDFGSYGFASCHTFLSLTESLKNLGLRMDLVIYDNNPGDGRLPIENFDCWNITYIADSGNSGVSKAYNKAAEIAGQRFKKWLLLLDEDTDFPINTIAAYLSAITLRPGEQLFAPVMLTQHNQIISPCTFRFMRGFYAAEAHPGVNSLKGKSLINCGICIKLDAFKQLNGYNEAIKLDFSDHDFIRRFKTHISDSFVVIDLWVKHRLSTSTRNSVAADLKRFSYYLDGSGYFSKTPAESIMMNLNVLLRSLKLSVVHRDAVFFTRAIKNLF
jgi:rhamnosyltransferase